MLEKVSLFNNLPSDVLEQLEHISVVRKYPKNTILFMEGDASSHLYIIKHGKVSVFVADEDGRQIILNHVGEGECFGELALIDNKPRSASVSTVTASEFIAISRQSFQDLLQKNTQLCHEINQALVHRIRELTHSVKDLALLDVYGRVSHTLEKLSDDTGRIQSPKVTHQDIANMVGSSREMVSRIMKQLIIGEYIEQQPQYIQIQRTLPKGW